MTIEYWANEGGKRIRFTLLGNGDVKIGFVQYRVLDEGQVGEELTLSSYRWNSVVESLFIETKKVKAKLPTRLQDNLLRFYRDFKADNGEYPVYKEARLGLHYGSNSAVQRHVEALIKKGFLSREKYKRKGLSLTKMALEYLEKSVTQQSLDKGDGE